MAEKVKQPDLKPSEQEPKIPAQDYPPLSNDTQWQKDAMTYLESRGWEILSRGFDGTPIYKDPNGINARAVDEEYRLPNDQGGFDTFKRKVGPPCPWDYPLPVAVGIQRLRDAAGGGSTPMERLTELHRQFDKLSLVYRQLVAAVTTFTMAPTPPNVNEWMVWKQKMANALDAAERTAKELQVAA